MRLMRSIRDKTGLSPVYIALIVVDLSISCWWYLALTGYNPKPRLIIPFADMLGNIIVLKLVVVMIAYFAGEKIEKRS